MEPDKPQESPSPQSRWVGRFFAICFGSAFLYWGYLILRTGWQAFATGNLHHLGNLPLSGSMLVRLLEYLYFIAYLLMGGGFALSGAMIFLTICLPKSLIDRAFWGCLPGMVAVLLAAVMGAVLLLGRLIVRLVI